MEGYHQLVKYRGIGLGHEVLQISDDPFELQLGKNRKEIACRRRQKFASLVRMLFEGLESNVESFEPGQH